MLSFDMDSFSPFSCLLYDNFQKPIYWRVVHFQAMFIVSDEISLHFSMMMCKFAQLCCKCYNKPGWLNVVTSHYLRLTTLAQQSTIYLLSSFVLYLQWNQRKTKLGQTGRSVCGLQRLLYWQHKVPNEFHWLVSIRLLVLLNTQSTVLILY